MSQQPPPAVPPPHGPASDGPRQDEQTTAGAPWPGGGFGVAPGQPPTATDVQAGASFQSYQGNSASPQHPGYPSYPAYPGYPGGVGATTSSVPGSTVVLLAVSVVSVVAVGIVGIPSAVIAALAWRQHRGDPVGARRRTTTGWIVYAVNFAIGVVVLIPFYVWALGRQ